MRFRCQAALVLLFVAVAACQSLVHIPDTLYTPDIAGVVKVVTNGDARTTSYTLVDGRVVTIDWAKAKAIKGTGNGDPGDLLLAGADGSWMSALRTDPVPEAPQGCFGLAAAGLDDGDHIKFDNGLRIAKATSFDPGPARNGVYDWPQHTFCVDATGGVTLYR